MENKIKEEIEKLVIVSQTKEIRQKDFISDKKLLHLKTGELQDLNYSLEKEYKIRYLDLISKSIYFQNVMQEKYQDDFIALFITLTANTQYHKYKSITNTKAVFNSRYQGYSINEAYKLLNSVKRDILKELSKKDRGRIKIDNLYLQVIEMHKSLTPHLHMVLYIPKEHLEYVVNILKRKMKCTDEQRIITSFTRNDKVVNQNKYLINSNYHKNKQNDVGICQIEILQDTKKAVGYISKYIKKQFSSNNLDDIYLLDGWKREHKIKLVLTSRTPVPKYIYDSIFRKLEKEEKEKFKDLFCDIQNSTKINIENTNSNKVKTKQAIKEEVFETYVTKSTKTVTKKDLEIEKKICARTLEEISTKRDFEANINTPIFNLFIQNISHKKLNKTLIKNSLFVKSPKKDDIPIVLDRKLALEYKKYISKLFKKIEKVDEKILRITKIERLVIQYMDDVIYDSDDWELIEYQKEATNKKVA